MRDKGFHTCIFLLPILLLTPTLCSAGVTASIADDTSFDAATAPDRMLSPTTWGILAICIGIIILLLFVLRLLRARVNHITHDLRKAKEELQNKNLILSSVLAVSKVIPWEYDRTTHSFVCDHAVYHHQDTPQPDSKGNYSINTALFFKRTHPDYCTHVASLFNDVMQGRCNICRETYPYHWYTDNAYEWIEVLCTRVSFPGENEDRIMGGARLVSVEKRMQESLRKAKEEAEQSNRLKSAFLANMSHELRTPLNAIVGFSQLLAATDDPDEKQEYLKIISNSNTLLLQLIADILDLTKIEAGTLEFSFGDYDLNQLMAELEQTARMKVQNPGVEICWTDRTEGCIINTDRNRLLQVLYNFISNAAKFTEQGSIRFGYRPLKSREWYFFVQDTGKGIPSAHLHEVFGRFVRIHKDAKGTGLGLAISKSIVERLGGRIGVDSMEGKGSTFWFTLPAQAIRFGDEAGSKTRSANSLTTNETPKTKKLKILAAEDNEVNYKLLASTLGKRYTLLHAWNGVEAIELYGREHPDAILMDIKMPELDGYEATAAIRELSTDVPIIAVTAFAYPEDRQRVLSSGFDAYLTKPIKVGQIDELLQQLIGRKKS